MKIIKQIPYDSDPTKCFKHCDLCDASEYDGPCDFLPMFEAKAAEDGIDVQYVLCRECANETPTI